MTACRTFVRKFVALGTLMLLVVSGAWATEFRDKAERIFSPSVIESVKESGTNAEIVFKVPERAPDYFESGDKANKVFAIESARIFRDVPALKRLTLKVPKAGGVKEMTISRADIEKYYKVDFAAMSGDANAWRNEFIQRYDTKEARAGFVKYFVKNR